MTSRHGLVLLVCLLGACAPAAPEATPAEGAREVPMTTAALVGPAAQAVEVVVSHLPPGVAVERIALIGPAGQVVVAREMTHVTVEPGADITPSFGFGAAGGSSSGVDSFLGLGLSFNILDDDPEARGERYTSRIPLPDPGAYRAEAERWRVEVRGRDAAGRPQVFTSPAPRPR